MNIFDRFEHLFQWKAFFEWKKKWKDFYSKVSEIELLFFANQFQEADPINAFAPLNYQNHKRNKSLPETNKLIPKVNLSVYKHQYFPHGIHEERYNAQMAK